MQLQTKYLDLKSQLIIEIYSVCLQFFANVLIEHYSLHHYEITQFIHLHNCSNNQEWT